MKTEFFLLNIDPESGQFDDATVTEFQVGREIIEVAEHMIMSGGSPAWAVMLTYRGDERQRRDRRDKDPLKIPEADRALYEALRAWRNREGRRLGKAPFVLFKNAQLLNIAQARPTSLAALREVQGVGEGRASAYGEAVLAVVEGVTAKQPSEET